MNIARSQLRAPLLGVLAALLLLLPLLALPLAADRARNESAGAEGPVGEAAAAPRFISGQSPLVVPAAAFTGDGNGLPESYFFSFGGGYLLSDDNTCHQAPLRLPPGVTVIRAGLAVSDDDPASEAIFTLWQLDAATGINRLLANLKTGLATASPEMRYLVDDSISSHPVAANLRSYAAGVCLRGDVRFRAVVVEFATLSERQYLPAAPRGSQAP